MPVIRTYLKSGQVIESVCHVETNSRSGVLTNTEWKDIKSGERIIYADASEIAAITEVIDPEK